MVFNGGTNDAYEPVISRLGNAESQSRDTDTFAGAFRATIDAIRKNWPGAKVVYIAVHWLGYRDRTVQQALHETELSICADMGVRVVNLYDECGLDTSDEVMCRTYSFDRLVNGLPAPGDQPTGTHPNLKAIREFYVPFLVDTLNRAELFCFGKTVWDVRDDGMMLFWELPEGAEETDRYRIFVDGQQIGETGLTHYRISGLCPDTRYEIRLVAVRGGQVLQTVRTFCRTESRKERIDVTKAPYFAKGDGVTMNTKNLQRAIDDCGPGQAVYFPKGVFLTGALRLHGDMELYIERDGTLKGSKEPDDYLPRIPSRFEGIERETYSGLLNIGEMDHNAGCTTKNIVIRGEGTIEGGGKALAKRVIRQERERLSGYLASLGDEIAEYENSDTIPGRVRPRLIHICNAKNVSISGLSIKNGACWNVHMIYSEHILTYDCKFYSREVWNGDGWDPDSSRDCVIFGCTFDTGDDAVAIKSGKNPEGNRIGRCCERIRIFDCTSLFGHGIAIGSEMSGGIRDVRIWNCNFAHSANGVEIKATKKRGGYVRDVCVTRCTVPRIRIHYVAYNDDGEAAPEEPVLENFRFTDVIITGMCLNEETGGMEACDAIELCGRQISLDRVRIACGEPKIDSGSDCR